MSRTLLYICLVMIFFFLVFLLILSKTREKLEAEKEKNKKAAKIIDAVIKNKEEQRENEELKNKINGNPDSSAFSASVELLQKCAEKGNTRNN